MVSGEFVGMGGKNRGAMVISLDFELMWGVIDHHNIRTYGERILGARLAVEKILELFEEYNIHATWAVVGFLFCRDREELENNIPSELPQYSGEEYSTYRHIGKIKSGEEIYYFAPDLVKKIKNTRNQEMASHTYSHYYCLEKGQTAGQFEADIKMYKEMGGPVRSIVLPRNQFNPNYNIILQKNGICNYRGNEKNWCYHESDNDGNNLFKRGFRLLDAYINLFGYHCYSWSEIQEGKFCNIRSSRFLRPYSRKLAKLEPLRMQRIKKQMLFAARNSRIFHIWWHPHNFGVDIDENMKNLREILDYYKELENEYGFLSMSMNEAGNI